MNGYAVCRKTYFPAQPQKPNKRNRQNRVFFDRRQRQTLSAAHWRHGRRQRHSFSKRQNCKGAFLRLIINFLGLCSKRAFFIQKNTGDLLRLPVSKKARTILFASVIIRHIPFLQFVPHFFIKNPVLTGRNDPGKHVFAQYFALLHQLFFVHKIRN